MLIEFQIRRTSSLFDVCLSLLRHSFFFSSVSFFRSRTHCMRACNYSIQFSFSFILPSETCLIAGETLARSRVHTHIWWYRYRVWEERTRMLPFVMKIVHKLPANYVHKLYCNFNVVCARALTHTTVAIVSSSHAKQSGITHRMKLFDYCSRRSLRFDMSSIIYCMAFSTQFLFVAHRIRTMLLGSITMHVICLRRRCTRAM